MRVAKTHKRKKSGSFKSALLLGFIFGVMLVISQEMAYQYRLQKQYKGSSETVISVPRPTVSLDVEATVTVRPESPSPSQEPEIETEGSGTPVGYYYSASNNDVTIEVGAEEITLDFFALESENADFTGWFVIPGTDISYPVVQGTDNAFYLNHIFSGAYGTVGTLFADCNNMMLEDENTIIYGHNFHQYGAMFSKLLYFENQDYYEEHPVMYYLTKEGGYKIEVFSAYEASTSDAIYTLSFAGDDCYKVFLDHVVEMSAIQSDVEVTVQDKVITLSTCSNRYSDGRFVVVGKVSAFS